MEAYYQAALGKWFDAQIKDTPLPETAHGGSKDIVTLNGQQYGRIYIDFLMRICNFAENANFSDVRTVTEIGGGVGAWPHLLLNRYPTVRKVILIYLDIPPMIYVWTQYLRHFFGDAIRDYRQTRSMESIKFRDDESLEIICICPWQIERLDVSVDLFWNSASFGEMTPEIVANYGQHLRHLIRPKTGIACLILNKLGEHPTTTMPDQTIGAFGEAISFEDFEPTVEHEYVTGRYMIGHATGSP